MVLPFKLIAFVLKSNQSILAREGAKGGEGIFPTSPSWKAPLETQNTFFSVSKFEFNQVFGISDSAIQTVHGNNRIRSCNKIFSLIWSQAKISSM